MQCKNYKILRILILREGGSKKPPKLTLRNLRTAPTMILERQLNTSDNLPYYFREQMLVFKIEPTIEAFILKRIHRY